MSARAPVSSSWGSPRRRDLADAGREKLRGKRLDLLVVNEVGREGTGFGSDTNVAMILSPTAGDVPLRTWTKAELAAADLRPRRRPPDGGEPTSVTAGILAPTMSKSHLFTSESVTEGHPDKLADQLSRRRPRRDARQDPNSRVACETLVTTGLVFVAGEITTDA